LHDAFLNGDDISTSEMNDAEQAIFGIGLIDELRAIVGAATAYEAELQGYWADLEKARKALRN
jgi:hypothetical protein